MPALVLARDLERADQEQHQDEQDDDEGDQGGGHVAILHRCTRSVSPSSASTCDGSPSRERLVRADPPELAVDEDEAVLAHDARHPDDLLRADLHRLASRLRPPSDAERPGAADQRP